MSSVRVTTEGFAQLQAQLRALGPKVTNKLLLQALRAGAKPIVADARARAPVLQNADPRRRAGVVRKAIRATKAKPLDRAQYRRVVQVNIKKLSKKAIQAFKDAGGGAGANPNDPFYWFWLERGTSKMAAQPFMRPAFDAKKMQALAEIKRKLSERIVEEARSQGGPT